MHARQRDNGKWQFEEWYVDPLTGKRKRASVTLDKNTAATRREAQKLINQKIDEKTARAAAAELTLAEAVRLYLTEKKMTVKVSTWTRDEYAAKTMMQMLGEDTLLSSLTAGYIRKKMLESGRKKSTLNEDLKRIKVFLRWCYRADYIDDIRFLDKLTPYKVDKPDESLQYLEGDELALLIAGLHIPVNRFFIQFLALTGVRLGEAVALRRDDVDGDYIHITKSYSPHTETDTTPKTAASVRDIYIQTELRELLKEMDAYYKRRSILSPWLLCDLTGERMPYRRIEKYFRESCIAILGVPYHVHSLRHTHASLLFEQGMTLDAVSMRLGHSDSRVTRQVYLHVTERKKQEYEDRIKEIRLVKNF